MRTLEVFKGRLAKFILAHENNYRGICKNTRDQLFQLAGEHLCYAIIAKQIAENKVISESPLAANAS